MDLVSVLEYSAIGLFGGAIGSLVGLAGATFIIPLATLLLAPHTPELRCAAMISNVCVAAGAIWPYASARQIDWPGARLMMPTALVAVIAGVLVSKGIDPLLYRGLFGLFLVVIVLREVRAILTSGSRDHAQKPISGLTGVSVGMAAGLASGVLSVGGGVVIVPVLREFLHIPVKRATGTSMATILPIVIVGAVTQVATLRGTVNPDGSSPLWDALAIAACLSPAALVGGWIGALLNGRWSKRRVHWAVAIGLTFAAIMMLQPAIKRYATAGASPEPTPPTPAAPTALTAPPVTPV